MTRIASSIVTLAAVCAAASPASAAQGVLVVETSTVNGKPRPTQVQIEHRKPIMHGHDPEQSG